MGQGFSVRRPTDEERILTLVRNEGQGAGPGARGGGWRSIGNRDYGEAASAGDEVVGVGAGRLVLKVQAEQIDFILAALGKDFDSDSAIRFLGHIDF